MFIGSQSLNSKLRRSDTYIALLRNVHRAPTELSFVVADVSIDITRLTALSLFTVSFGQGYMGGSRQSR